MVTLTTVQEPAGIRPCKRRSKSVVKCRAKHVKLQPACSSLFSIPILDGAVRDKIAVARAVQYHAAENINVNALGGLVERLCFAEGSGLPSDVQGSKHEEKLAQVRALK